MKPLREALGDKPSPETAWAAKLTEIWQLAIAGQLERAISQCNQRAEMLTTQLQATQDLRVRIDRAKNRNNKGEGE